MTSINTQDLEQAKQQRQRAVRQKRQQTRPEIQETALNRSQSDFDPRSWITFIAAKSRRTGSFVCETSPFPATTACLYL